MKKLIVTLTAVAVLAMSLLSVAASEQVESDLESRNMDGETYMELRIASLNEALASGQIGQEDYEMLVAHITENVENETFAKGPQGYLAEDSECVLGEDGQLGIFRNENSGIQGGLGNGIRNQSADGSETASRGTNKGADNQSANRGSKGIQLQDGSGENEECILD